MATRYAGDFEFDHGAQYFTARTRAFREFLEPLIGEKLISPWRARYVEISPTGALIQRTWDESEPRYVGVPRMNVVGKALAGGLDIRFGTEVERVERSGTGWRLLFDDTREPVGTDWLLVTAPLPQAKALLADVEGQLCDAYGVWQEKEKSGVKKMGIVRSTFLIDKQGVVRHQVVNDMPLGRNVNEYLRLIDAYTHVQEKGEVCPANWEEGKDAMKATREGVADYLSSHAD